MLQSSQSRAQENQHSREPLALSLKFFDLLVESIRLSRQDSRVYNRVVHDIAVINLQRLRCMVRLAVHHVCCVVMIAWAAVMMLFISCSICSRVSCLIDKHVESCDRHQISQCDNETSLPDEALFIIQLSGARNKILSTFEMLLPSFGPSRFS